MSTDRDSFSLEFVGDVSRQANYSIGGEQSFDVELTAEDGGKVLVSLPFRELHDTFMDDDIVSMTVVIERVGSND